MSSPFQKHPAPAHDPITQTLALLQPWIEYVPQQQRRLGLFVFLALLVHLAAFLFVRLDSTRPELQSTSRLHVAVDYPKALAVSGEDGDDLWDRLTDPRLFLTPSAPAAGVGTDEPALESNPRLGSNDLPLPAAPDDYRAARPITVPLEQRVTESMLPPRQPFIYHEPPPPKAAKTTWQWDAALAALQPAGAPELPAPISDSDLSPTVLRIAVGPEGEVEHVLVEQSSDEWGAAEAKDLDAQAVLAAGKLRFQPTGKTKMVWGQTTVFWSYSAKPRDDVVPTPPTPQ